MKKYLFTLVLMVCAVHGASHIALCAGPANSPWPMYRQNMYHTGLSTITVSGTAGRLRWKYQTGSGIASSAALGADGTIYIGGDDRYVRAITPAGTLKWQYLTGGYVNSSPAVGSDGTVYVGSLDNSLYAITSAGALKWQYATGDQVFSSPSIGSDGTVYFGSSDKYVYALSSTGSLNWKYLTGDIVYSPPAVGSNGIYVGSFDNFLYALNPDGSLQWKYATSGSIYSSPAIAGDGTIYVGSNDGSVYALNPSGSLKWHYVTNGSVYSSPAIGADGTVYVGSSDNSLYALNPADGSLQWQYVSGGSIGYNAPAIGGDGTVYFGSYDHNLYALTSSGTLKWKYFLSGSGSADSSPVIGSDGTVYIGSSDNNVYAVVVTTPPVLSWTGEPNYTSGGLYPTVGQNGTPFTFRIQYSDANNVAPANGYPKVHILKSGSEISGSPFSMTYVSGTNSAGAIYTFPTTLTSGGTDYTYSFEAYDVWGTTATGLPLSQTAGPTVVSMTSVTPASAYNSSPVVALSITGVGYSSSSIVTFRQSGQSDVTATAVSANQNQINCTVDLTGAATGYWDIVISTGGPGSFQATFSNAFMFNAMTIYSIAPYNGANTMPLSVTNLAGAGFVPGSTVKITKVGQSDINATGVTFVNTTELTCTLNLIGAATGYWNVVVSTGGPGSLSTTLIGGLYVNIIAIATITPDAGINNASTLIAQVSGGGFAAGDMVKLSKYGQNTIIASPVTVISPTQITCALSLDGAATGYWDVIVSTGGVGSTVSTLYGGFLIQPVPPSITQLLNDSIDSVVTLQTVFGYVTANVPAGTFGQNVMLTISTATVPGSNTRTIKGSDIDFEITNNLGLQPRKTITITVQFRTSDIVGLVESKLMLAYYDDPNNRLVTVPSTVNSSMNTITALDNHLSRFEVVQLASAGTLSAAKAYPIPFNPTHGKMTFDNLTEDATIRIFTIAGQLVRTVGNTAGNGRALWDGTNDSGATLASGIYIAIVEDASASKQLKIAIEK